MVNFELRAARNKKGPVPGYYQIIQMAPPLPGHKEPRTVIVAEIFGQVEGETTVDGQPNFLTPAENLANGRMLAVAPALYRACVAMQMGDPIAVRLAMDAVRLVEKGGTV